MSVVDVARECPAQVVILNRNDELLLLKYRGESGKDVILYREALGQDAARPGIVLDDNAMPGGSAICQVYDLPADGPLIYFGIGELDESREREAKEIASWLTGKEIR